MKIAVDVVLLPPKEIMEKAIEINKRLADDSIKLNKENCLPHISLCMGVVEEENLPKIKEIIKKMGESFSKLTLTINKIDFEGCCFEFENNKNLQRLHETIIEKLAHYLTYDATVEMCFSPPSVIKKTLFWINNYQNTSFENFYPHLTLGATKIKGKEVNIKFTASKIAICHLGNYCTCRKILYETKLKNKK